MRLQIIFGLFLIFTFSEVASATFDSMSCSILRVRNNPIGLTLEYWDNRSFPNFNGIPNVGAPLNGLMEATFWVRWSNTPTFSKLILKFQVLDSGWVLVTCSGFLTDFAYLAPVGDSGFKWGNLTMSSDQPGAVSLSTVNPVTNDFFTMNKVYVIIPLNMVYSSGGGGSVAGTSNSASDIPIQVIDPALAGPGVDATGNIVVAPQDLSGLPGQTSKFWADWKIELKPLDMSTNVSSYYSNIPMDWSRSLSFNPTDSFVNKNLPDTVSPHVSWYRDSSVKTMVDAVFLGFATFAAFLMPYHAFRRGGQVDN